MKTHGIKTLAELTVRTPRRRRWWTAISGLDATGARQIEAFFAAHPHLSQQARALVPIGAQYDVVPRERLGVPDEVNGSRGAFLAPKATCALDANNDYEAVQACLALHESMATQRGYRKEAERLILWAIVERGRPLSSLTTDCQAVRRIAGRGSTDQGSICCTYRDHFPESGGRLLLTNAFANDLREEIRLSNSPGA